MKLVREQKIRKEKYNRKFTQIVNSMGKIINISPTEKNTVYKNERNLCLFTGRARSVSKSYHTIGQSRFISRFKFDRGLVQGIRKSSF